MDGASFTIGTNRFIRVRAPIQFQVPQVASPAAPAVDDRQVRLARAHIVELAEAISEISNLLRQRPNRVTVGNGAAASSQQNLGLDPTPATAARLNSTAEVNTTPTSFTPFGPSWAGSSTALLTIGGEYDINHDSGTLTFEVKNGGTHGSDNLQISVYEPDNTLLQQLNINKNDPLDQTYNLANGLTLKLGAGDLNKDDAATVTVSNSVGSQVDPDKPFNGTRNADPNLEPGQSISAGSFEIEGVNINVAVDDSLNDVLAAITASSAGVDAAFDPATESVRLTQKSTGSAPTISLGTDSSGFFDATKLSGAPVTPGTDYEPSIALANLAQFATVSSGTYTINNVGLGLDVDNQSLLDVINVINTSGAGATASLTPDAQRLTLLSDDPREELTIDSGLTGLFSALWIDDGSYDPNRTSRGISATRARAIGDALGRATAALRELFNDKDIVAAKVPGLSELRNNVRAALDDTLEGFNSSIEKKLGLNLGLDLEETGLLDFDRSDKHKFSSELQADVRLARKFFIGRLSREGDGFLGLLYSSLKDNYERFGLEPGQAGGIVDTFV